MTTPIIEPRIGAVYCCNYSDRSQTRYIIIDVKPPEGGHQLLQLVSVQSQRLSNFWFRDHDRDDDFITFEPLADGEEVLFFQAMIAPQTLKGAGHDQSTA